MFFPASRMRPSVGVSSPVRSFAAVDLPLPLAPTRPRRSRSYREKVMASTACVRAASPSKCMETLSKRRSGGFAQGVPFGGLTSVWDELGDGSPIRGIEESRFCVSAHCGWASSSAVAPCSMMRPCFMTAARSAMWRSTPILCVTRSIPVPSSSRMVRRIWSTCRCSAASSAEVGSSASRRRGRRASASAIAARCAIPPDSVKG